LALDRKIIAIFSFAFLGFIGLMVHSYNSREYVETLEADVIQAHANRIGVRGPFTRLLWDYEYYLELRNIKGIRKLEVDYELFREFLGRTGVVVLEKYYRPGFGLFEYDVNGSTS